MDIANLILVIKNNDDEELGQIELSQCITEGYIDSNEIVQQIYEIIDDPE